MEKNGFWKNVSLVVAVVALLITAAQFDLSTSQDEQENTPKLEFISAQREGRNTLIRVRNPSGMPVLVTNVSLTISDARALQIINEQDPRKTNSDSSLLGSKTPVDKVPLHWGFWSNGDYVFGFTPDCHVEPKGDNIFSIFIPDDKWSGATFEGVMQIEYVGSAASDRNVLVVPRRIAVHGPNRRSRRRSF